MQSKMPRTLEDKAFFDTFGFFVFRQAFSEQEIQGIDDAFEQVITHELQAKGLKRDQLHARFVIEPGFCERHPVFRDLIEDERITGTIEHLLGPQWFYAGSDGSLWAGDTPWHVDGGWNPNIPRGRTDPNLDRHPNHYYPGIKVAVYPDPLTKDNGALRVIPGSHISPFHESLAMLHSWIPEVAPQLRSDPTFKQFDLEQEDVPAFAIESNPGDLVFFSNQTWHAALGSQPGRRMFAMSYKGRPTNARQEEWAEGRKRRVADVAKELAN